MILRRRKIVIATLIAALGGGAWWALEAYSIFGASYFHRPKIDPTPALKPDTHTSTIMIPVAIDLAEIRSALEAAAPRSFKGKRENPIAGPFGKSEIGWVIRRELLALAGQPEGMTVSAGLTGDILVGETLTGSTNDDPISGLIGFIASAFEQRGKMRGQVKLDSRPTLQPNWRIDPKLSGQISIPDGGLTINGFPIEVSGDVKTAIDKAVAEQIEELGKQVGDDKTIETIARGQWDRICKSISLSAISRGNPDMYLQIKPVRAFAAHPVSGEKTATVTLGLEAEARVVATGAQPSCAFPATLEIVPPVDRGHFKIAAPIDLPFSDINAMLDRSLRGRTFPENADAWAQVTVQRARVIPSGDRLLVELIVKAREEATWFGFGARATVYVWVRPKLDTAEQKLRFADMTVDVRSRAAWGLFGAAARLALPYIQEELESNAVIDLKPYVASARSGIEAAVAAFDKQDDGVNASASVTDLRLTDVAFDGTVVRLTVEGEGAAKMEIVKLPDRK